MSLVPALWAVHISDGILHPPWIRAGFVLIGLLVLIASWRIREEEIPRIALMSAAFFVASSIHVKIPPTSAHLLLNGLVGIVLGRRAPIAILIGVTLQAFLIAHGGITTIGVNACTQSLPALLVAALFPVLYHLIHGRHAWTRSLFVAGSVILWGACLVIAIALMAQHGVRGNMTVNDRAGVVFSFAGLELAGETLAPAVGVLLRPVTLIGLLSLGLLAVALERRWPTAPDFALGAFLGIVSVLATTMLTGFVLIADSAERWSVFASVVLVAHLPIAIVEGIILGCTLGFLSRVKPEMLGVSAPPESAKGGIGVPEQSISEGSQNEGNRTPQLKSGTTFLLALAFVLLSGGNALAHRLSAGHRIDLANRSVIVESWYETDDIPHQAQARVVRADGTVLAEGPLDSTGKFVFAFDKAEPLIVHVTAPGGHRATTKIEATELQGAVTHGLTELSTVPDTMKDRRDESHVGVGEGRIQSLILGVTLLLAAAAFVMSWNNHRRLRRLGEQVK